MKFKVIAILSLSATLIFTGCSNQNNMNNQQTEVTTDVASTVETTVEKSTESNAETTVESVPEAPNHTIIRNESTVKNDSKTKSVITSQQSFQIGTYITISIYDDAEVPNKIFDDIFNLIDKYEYMISKNIKGTEISLINENAGVKPVKISSELFEIIQKGLTYAGESKGLFDIAIGPLVDLWGIGTDHAAVPAKEKIEIAKAFVDYKKVILNEADLTVFLAEKGMVMDLGGIAKGFIADRLKELIVKEGYKSAIINLGGNVLTVGNKPNSDAWSIGVRDPNEDAGSIIGVLKLEDNSIVSSGIYERFFFDNDIRYHHIINPMTGYPEQNEMLSVSMVTKSSVDGDALSTTIFLLGLDEGFAYVENHPGIEAVFVMSDSSVYVTSGLKDLFTLTSKNYKIVSK